MSSIEAALADLELLKPGESINYTKVAKYHGVSRSTLSRHHRGIQRSREEQYENQRFLNHQQTKDLIDYINKQTRSGIFISHQMIANFAQEIAGKPSGKNWVSRFLKKHDNDLLSHHTTAMDASRNQTNSAFKYSFYFDAMARKIEQYEIQQENIYNMDEKGFLIGILPKGKRVFSKRAYECEGIKQRLQDDNQEWITTIACICADKTSLSPGLIYQAVSSKLQDSWQQDFDTNPHQCFFASSPSGWTNDELGYAWLRDIFDRETKEKASKRWRLLVLDGHGSYVTMQFLDYCDDNRIILVTYPPHSTHSLQPLDVGIFSSLSGAYGEQLEAFLHASEGLSAISKRDFFRLFWPSWNQALSANNIESSWRSVGIWPWNPQIVLSRSSRIPEEKPSSSESSRSLLKADDWRRIEKLLKQVVSEVYDQDSKKLSSTMHDLFMENMMLKSRCQSLQEALVNEKKKRQRVKPPIVQLQEEENGNAVFYSPKKIQQARDLQKEKDQAIEPAKASKEEAKLCCQQEKEGKQQIIEEGKRIRVSNKQLLLHQAEEKKRQKEAEEEEARMVKEASIQLQNDVNTARKGKTKLSTSSAARKKQDIVALEAVVVAEASTKVNRRGREIRLPTRFRDD